MLRTIGQVINEVRREKRVSLAEIVALGISKSRYYRFIEGEIDMSMIDMMSIMDALTISFSELGLLTGKSRFQDISIRWLMNADINELTQRTQGVDDQDTDFRKLLFQAVVALRKGESMQEAVTQMYERLVTIDIFTLLDIVAFAVIAPELTVGQFKRLYLCYARSMSNFQNYLTNDMYDAVLTIHLAAVDKLLVQPENRSYDNSMFVIETILNQYSEPQFMELRILQQMMQLFKTTVEGLLYTTTSRMTILLLAVKNQHVETVKTRLISVDLLPLWNEIQVSTASFWIRRHEHDAFPRFSTLPPEELFEHFGDVLRRIMKQKHITPGMAVDAGISTYKLYRTYNETHYLELEELITLMRLVDLMPSDIDAVMRRRVINVTNSTWHQYNWQHVNPLGYDAMARSMEKLYEETHLRKDLEAYFEFKSLDGLFVRRNWLQGDAADELSKKIGNELMGMEVWHAAEFRVMRYALLHVDTKAGVEMWSRSIRKALNEADQQYIQHNAVLDIYEWAILRAMLLHNKELAKSLLKESRVVNNNPADVPLFGRGQRRLFELYEDLIDEVPTARRQLQEHLSDFVILSGDSKFTDAYQKILRPYWEK